MKNQQEVQKQYQAFKESGDLKALFKGMSGDWEKDKVRFTRIYEENQRIIEEATKDLT
jgi:hypothetical protein